MTEDLVVKRSVHGGTRVRSKSVASHTWFHIKYSPPGTFVDIYRAQGLGRNGDKCNCEAKMRLDECRERLST